MSGFGLTRLFTESGSWLLNVVPLSPEHRDIQADKDTERIIYRSQQRDTISTIRASKIKGVVSVPNG